MIRYLTGRDKLWCRDLWEEAFSEDSKSFCDYYFQEKLKDNRILAITGEEDGENYDESGRVEAMIQLNPYPLIVGKCCWRVDYLVGVATRKEKQRRGYMRRLLLRMFTDLRREKAPFCFLMPAKEAIYRPFGFTYIFRQPQFTLKRDDSLQRRPIRPYPLNDALLSEAAKWMEAWMARRYQVYALRDEDYLRRLVKEIASENGTLDLLYDENRVAGMLGQWGWDKKVQRLLYGEESYVWEEKAPKPAIMARIISPEIFVQVIHLSEKAAAKTEEMVVPLHLSDPLIAENDGNWLWRLNRETSWLERAASLEDQQNGKGGKKWEQGLSLTVDEMTAWLFGYEIPKAAMSYADLVEPLRGVFLDEVV